MVLQLQKRSSELRDEQKRLTQESMRIEKEIANLNKLKK